MLEEEKRMLTTNEEITERYVEGIYSGQRLSDKISSFMKKSISSENRILQMCQAKSKGSELNTFQIISCLGQQMGNGKRIPLSNTNRTLPHFTQFDEKPDARGYVYTSFASTLRSSTHCCCVSSKPN